MGGNWKTVRVFISSTFRDMHAERDYLVKVVFPQLRWLCESRGVTWGEVDLRWGVTDEAAAEGRVLPICLEEINRCRPYFIGLLGERYGWVPQTIPQELLEKETWLQEQFQERKSVTELEILHGVLRNPAMAGHAFFYFRDAAYIQKLPPGFVPADFISEDTASAAKLHQLKQLIRASGVAVRENYPNAQALGELVLADLTAIINQRWPEGSQTDPLDRDALEHVAYARSRERVYIGRPEYFARLDAHAAGEGGQPLVVLGESGCGKSALLANWAAGYRRAHPDAFVLEHYIGATPGSADWAALLRRLMGEFKRKLGVQQAIPDKPDDLRDAFSNWLKMASARCQGSGVRDRGTETEESGTRMEGPPGTAGSTGMGTDVPAADPAAPPAQDAVGGPGSGPSKIVIILDALNQLEDREGAQELLWLPPVLPGNVRLIVSTLPGKPLNEVEKRGWPNLRVEPLAPEKRRELVRQFLGQYGRQLSLARLDRIVAAPQSANPLYLRVLLDELRLFGIHEQLDARIDYYLQAQSPCELYGKVIARWDADYGCDSGLAGDTLSLLWASRRGLSEAELLDALGQAGQPLPRAVWSPLFLAMADALISRGGLLTFAHDFLRAAARDAYVPTDSHQRQAHKRLADYFERQPSGPRRTEELPWQLARAGEWHRLADLLRDLDFFADAWQRDPDEVRALWTQLLSHGGEDPSRTYGIIWRTAVGEGRSVIAIGELLWAMGCAAEAEQALSAERDRCRRCDDETGYVRALAGLGVALRFRGSEAEARKVYEEQIAICRKRGETRSLGRILGDLATLLHESDPAEALSLFREQEQIARRENDYFSLQSVLGDQSLALELRGNAQEALALVQEAEKVCLYHNLRGELLHHRTQHATFLKRRGNTEEALRMLEDVEAQAREMSLFSVLANGLGEQAIILAERGQSAEAREKGDEAENLFRKTGDDKGLAKCLVNQSIMYMRSGLVGEAVSRAEEAVPLLQRLKHPAQTIAVCESIIRDASEDGRDPSTGGADARYRTTPFRGRARPRVFNAGCLQIVILALGVACGIFWLSKLSSVKQSPSDDLLLAAFQGKTDVAREMLDQGADVNYRETSYGFSPLFYAVCKDHPALAALLIEKGADVNVKTDSDSHKGQAPLHAAAEMGSAKLVKLLLEKGAHVDTKDKQGQTPLYLAVENERRAVIPLLIAEGADPNLPAKRGETPRALARRINRKDLLP